MLLLALIISLNIWFYIKNVYFVFLSCCFPYYFSRFEIKTSIFGNISTGGQKLCFKSLGFVLCADAHLGTDTLKKTNERYSVSKQIFAACLSIGTGVTLYLKGSCHDVKDIGRVFLQQTNLSNGKILLEFLQTDACH